MSYNIAEEGIDTEGISDEEGKAIGQFALRMSGVVLLAIGMSAAATFQLSRKVGRWSGYYCPEAGCTDSNGPVRISRALFKGDNLTCPDVIVFRSDLGWNSSRELVEDTCDVKLDPTPALTPVSDATPTS